MRSNKQCENSLKMPNKSIKIPQDSTVRTVLITKDKVLTAKWKVGRWSTGCL